jgi:hypothetical protein
MAITSEKAQCVYEYAESGKSAVTIQRNYRLVYRKSPPIVSSIKNWRENSWRLAVFSLSWCWRTTSTFTIQNNVSLQEFFTTVLNGVDTGWCFPVNSTVITLNGPRWFSWFSIPVHTLGFFRWCSHFYGRYLKEEKPIKSIFFSVVS